MEKIVYCKWLNGKLLVSLHHNLITNRLNITQNDCFSITARS